MFPTSAHHPIADPIAEPTAEPAAAEAPAAADDPRPQPPVEPQLEDCCGSGCVVCVFDAYEMARERHAQQLAAWLLRHPGAQ